MANDRSTLPYFAGTQDTEDLFLATMEEVDKDINNVIDLKDPLWHYLKSNNLLDYRSDTGSGAMKFPIMDEDNGTAGEHTGYDDADNTPTNALGNAIYPWGHFHVVQMYNRQEMVDNSGKGQIIDLVEAKTKQAEISLTNRVATKLRGTQTGDGRLPCGLGNLVAYNTASGGINPTAAGADGTAQSWWNPKMIYKTGTTPYALATEAEFRDGMADLYAECARYGSKPDCLLAGKAVYRAHQRWAEGKLNLRLEDLKKDQGLGSWNMFSWEGSTIIRDDALPDKEAWALNFKDGVVVRVHRGTNFIWTPWESLQGKVAAKKRTLLLYMGVGARDRRSSGKIVFS
jgi:hypothetical protein